MGFNSGFKGIERYGCYVYHKLYHSTFLRYVWELRCVFGVDFLLTICFQFIINRLEFVVDFCELTTEFVNTEKGFLL